MAFITLFCIVGVIGLAGTLIAIFAPSQARQVAATAQGAADKLRIEAKGQADANDLINKSLTPLLIQFQSIQKLSGTINTIIVPANSGFLLPSELFQAKP